MKIIGDKNIFGDDYILDCLEKKMSKFVSVLEFIDIFLAFVCIVAFLLMIAVYIQGFKWMNEWESGFIAIPTYNGWLQFYLSVGGEGHLIIAIAALFSVGFLIYNYS
jgi:TRAP-type C4-dicarboxylate transport system permease small subunit